MPRTPASLALLLTAIALQSCGFLFPQTSAPAAEQVSIVGAHGFSPLSGSHNILTRKRSLGGSDEFLSAVRRCGVNEGASLPGIARHLFVGLDRVTVRSRKEVALGDVAVLLLDVSAELDSQQVQLVTASALFDHCVTDVAVWWFADTSTEVVPSQIGAAQELVTSILTTALGLDDAHHS